MKLIPEFDGTSFDIEDAEDVMGLAKSLLNGMHPGILCTVDPSGTPQARWLSTLTFDEFPVFHTLTAPDSAKVRQIEYHPEVSWMFFNYDLSLILNLSGTARILRDTPTLKRIWRKVKDKSHAYFLEHYSKAPGFVVIETSVTSIQCSSPRHSLRFSVAPAGLRHEHYVRETGTQFEAGGWFSPASE